MTEGPPKPESPESLEALRAEYLELARELSESKETFPFPGIDPEIYPKIKVAEAEFPGYSTPIDELIVRFEKEGMNVVLGKPQSLRVYILPASSNDIEQDAIAPRQLEINDQMDEKLKKLIKMGRELFQRDTASA